VISDGFERHVVGYAAASREEREEEGKVKGRRISEKKKRSLRDKKTTEAEMSWMGKLCAGVGGCVGENFARSWKRMRGHRR